MLYLLAPWLTLLLRLINLDLFFHLCRFILVLRLRKTLSACSEDACMLRDVGTAFPKDC